MKFLAKIFVAAMLLVTLFGCRPSDNELLRQFDVNKKFSELSSADQTKALFLVRRSIGDYYAIAIKANRQLLVGKDSKEISDFENNLKTSDVKLALLMKDDSEIKKLIAQEYPFNIVSNVALTKLAISNKDLIERIDGAEKDGHGKIKDSALRKAHDQIDKDLKDIFNEITSGLKWDNNNFNPEALKPINSFLGIPEL